MSIQQITLRLSPAYQYESCNSRDKFYRHVSKGGWPFSTSAHGWPISDCTGEGLKGVLALMDSPTVMDAVKKGILNSMETSRLHDAVNVILTLQNEDGGTCLLLLHAVEQTYLLTTISIFCHWQRLGNLRKQPRIWMVRRAQSEWSVRWYHDWLFIRRVQYGFAYSLGRIPREIS